MKKLMIIGLTGTISSGKGAVADFLKNKDYVYLSLSDEVREEARNRKIEVTRENLQNLGNELREKYGKGVLAARVIKKIASQRYTNAIVDGIRNPEEVKELRKLPRFFLIAVDAPRELRFKRIVSRNRESDPKTFEEFLKVDKRDLGENERESGQQVAKCMEMADFKVVNDKDISQLNEKSDSLLKDIERKIPRPSWDEYFLEMAYLVSKRSTCLRRKVGAVLVKEKKILATGYNGAPARVKHCAEIGCLREELKVPSGQRHELCRAVHAEQNVISQAALHGISTKDSHLYITTQPCVICAKMIINAGIKEITISEGYPDEMSGNLLKEAGVTVRQIQKPQGF